MQITLDIDINEYNKLKYELDEILTKYSLTYSDFKLVNDALNYLYNEENNLKNIIEKHSNKKLLSELYECKLLIQSLIVKYNELDDKLDILKNEIDNKENELNIFARNAFIDMENKNGNSLMKIKSV